MVNYVIRRLLMLIPVFIIVAIVSFSILHLIPGNPAAMMLGPDATNQEIEHLTQKLGLDKPFLQQFSEFVGGLLRGDLGYSYYINMPVLDVIFEKIPVSFSLAILAELLALLIAIPLGVLSAIKQNTIVDQLCMSMTVFGISIPGFWLGIMFILFFSVILQWFPTQGYAPLSEGFFVWLRHLTLPAVSLGVRHSALIGRMTRSSMVEVLATDNIRTLRSKGLGEASVVFKHGLKNSLIPVVTVVGLSFTSLVGGALITETVFTLPGIGRLMLSSIQRRDYPVIQGVLMVFAGICVIMNLLVDVIYAYLDPRIKYQ